MRQNRNLSLPLLLAVLVGACAASTTSTQDTTKTDGVEFKNILVIGVANDYDGRARFERKLVSDLKGVAVGATTMYSVGGGNKPIERKSVEELVRTNGYDAVLISRVLSRDSEASLKTGSSATKAIRKEGRAIDLFRYDYEELNEPITIDTTLSVTILTELFAAENSQKVWSIEFSTSKKEDLEYLINEAAETIVRRLKRDKLLGN